MPGNPQLTQVILDDIGTVTDPMISKSDKIGVHPSLKWLTESSYPSGGKLDSAIGWNEQSEVRNNRVSVQVHIEKLETYYNYIAFS